MKSFKALCAFALLSSALWSGGVRSQTISQNFADESLGNSNDGQSFTATLTGQVTAIAVASGSGGTFDLRFYNGDSGSGTINSVGSPILPVQSVTLPATVPYTDPLTIITLSTPLPVVAGASYSFVISGRWEPQFADADLYSGGQLLTNDAFNFPAADLRFAIYESAAVPPVGSPASIPSSSEWSLIGASLLVLAAALFHRRRLGTRQRR